MIGFLYLNEESKVCITAEGKGLKSYKELDSRDRHTGKPWVNACLTYCYYMHYKEGIFYNLVIVHKKKKILSEFLDGKYSDSDFESDEYYKALEKDYIDCSYTMTEWLYRSIYAEIDGLKKRLSEIPWTKTAKVKVPTTIPNPDGQGTTTIMVEGTAEFDNSEEKFKALKMAETLLDYETKIRSKVLQEKKDNRKIGGNRAMFDK